MYSNNIHGLRTLPNTSLLPDGRQQVLQLYQVLPSPSVFDPGSQCDSLLIIIVQHKEGMRVILAACDATPCLQVGRTLNSCEDLVVSFLRQALPLRQFTMQRIVSVHLSARAVVLCCDTVSALPANDVDPLGALCPLQAATKTRSAKSCMRHVASSKFPVTRSARPRHACTSYVMLPATPLALSAALNAALGQIQSRPAFGLSATKETPLAAHAPTWSNDTRPIACQGA